MAIAVVQSDIEDVYGQDNVRRWSQLDANDESIDSSRVTKAINISLEKVQDRFRTTTYDINFVAQSGTLFTVVNWVATLAGVWLFFTRGNRNVSEDQDQSISTKMKADETNIMADIDTYLMNARKLQAQKDVQGPSAPVVIF